MAWQDYFYFSKGERTGFIVLISIVVIAVTILSITNNRESDQKTNETSNSQNVITELARKDSASSGKDEPTTKETIVAPNVARESAPQTTRESVSDRVNRLTSYSQPTYTRVEKFAEGTVVELNTADTTTLKKVPGIGSTYANRIVNYRTVLGGYHSTTQLSEVYGIDEERYQAFVTWFSVDASLVKKIQINSIPQDSLQRHPYISYAQARVIIQTRRQKGKLAGWENLQLLNEFTESDKKKLQPYLSFD